MKPLNDIIWNNDIDLEEEKENDVIKLGMKDICIINSCLGPHCAIDRSYNTMFTCIK